MNLLAPASSNDEETPGLQPRSSTITRSKKRTQTNSSPIVSQYRVFPDPDKEIISREPTPAETEVETSSAMSNAGLTVGNALKNSCRKLTAEKRANRDPENELGPLGRLPRCSQPVSKRQQYCPAFTPMRGD
ncbi:hypothetical protein BDV93DRAFT_561823 [Ceratobasidium sp. AG-I]|nr:hypothetical protein BDV93DRAFT_561823 [Ceratobasidium sp. AG-I]